MRTSKIFTLSGKVIEGQKIARELGFPTANIEVPNNLDINFGIYAGFVKYNQKQYSGVINIGLTPHFPVKKPKLEMHIFDFNDNIYGEYITIIATHYLREEMKFDNLGLLLGQIEQDCAQAKQILSI